MPRNFALSLLLAVSVAACGGGRMDKPAYDKGLIILGIDGMDPVLLQKYMDEGKTPNLKKLAEKSFMPLATSNPPQSPVAWSMFTTGQDSGGHGIYDFVHRDVVKLAPMLSTSEVEDADVMCVGTIPVPLGGGDVKLLREGRAFWEILGDQGIPSTLVMVPANFPPRDSKLTELISGMGTPDLMGTPGTFQLFTTDEEEAKKPLNGGIAHLLTYKDEQTAVSKLDGPSADVCEDDPVVRADLEITVDKSRPSALIRVGDAEVLLKEGEWSEWTWVSFEAGVVAGSYPGIIRMYLRSVRPNIHLYVSPINLDPAGSAMPISIPAHYAEDLAKDIGRFYTQEMKPDTKALSAGVLSEDEFLSQVDLVFEERMRLLQRELDRFKGGLLFFYISSVDQLSHVYFRALAEDASEHDRKYRYVIPDIYARADAAVGQVMERYGDKYDILVMSDHGFSPYKKKVNLNVWLAQQGYLAVNPEAKRATEGLIDWANTQAYAVGLNGLYLNVEGREAKGVVPKDEAEVLLRRLTRELMELTDPEDRSQVITEVVRPPVGEFTDRAPDLLIGYNRGYRSSDESATGLVVGDVIEPNTGKWSGDHCMDPKHVPGVLLSNRPIALSNPSLKHFGATVLDHFGVPRPDNMEGNSLWQKTK